MAASISKSGRHVVLYAIIFFVVLFMLIVMGNRSTVSQLSGLKSLQPKLADTGPGDTSLHPVTGTTLGEAESQNLREHNQQPIDQPFFSLTHSNSKPLEVPSEVASDANPTGTLPVTTERVVSTYPPLPTFHLSKDLFVRAVHFDSRPRDGHHNTSVFLVVCLKAITDNKLISGCMVDGRAAKHFSVKLIGETPLWRAFYDFINHEEVLVHCYDLPARNGSVAHITYRKTQDSEPELAASERPLLMPAPRIEPSSKEGKRYNMTVVTCAKIFAHPPWIEEWLTYQRTLGVDHVHLDAEDSFKNNGEMQKPFFAKMMAEGFVSVDVWKKYLSGNEIWYHNQGLIYEDCPYRFRGTYDYIVMMDTDDFFTPRVPTEKRIHYYIDKFCRGKGIGSCKFKWVEYYPDAVGINASVSVEDGNVTKALNSYSHYNQGNPKSLHRTTVLIDTATHYAYLMMPGYKIVSVPVSDAYVAHVRLQNKELPKEGKGLVTGLPNTCSEHLLSKLVLFTAMLVFRLTS